MSIKQKQNKASQLLDQLHARARTKKIGQSYGGQCVADLVEFETTCRALLNAGPNIAQLAQREQTTLARADAATQKQIVDLCKLVMSDVNQFTGRLNMISQASLSFKQQVDAESIKELDLVQAALELGQKYQQWMTDYETVLHGNVANLSDLIELTVQKYRLHA